MSDHPVRQAHAEALASGLLAVIPVGETVPCDIDDTDLTADTRSGGYLFGSYAAGPLLRRAADRDGGGPVKAARLAKGVALGLAFATVMTAAGLLLGEDGMAAVAGYAKRKGWAS